jgi:hypothetical protein
MNPTTDQTHPKLRQLRSISVLLDSQFRGPFGFRFGLDGIIGLIPIVGDVATTGVSFFVITHATLLGASPAVLIRMIFNVAVENVISVIPIFGNIFDFFWKSNNKNIALLERHLVDPQRTTRNSRWHNILFLFLILLLMFASMVAAYFMLHAMLHGLEVLFKKSSLTSDHWF